MATKFDRYGPWDIPYRATGVICPDGKARTVRLSGHADTFWTMPARLSYRGKTVSGFITNVDDIFDLGQQFIPTGKHRDIFGVSATGRYLTTVYIESRGFMVVAGSEKTRIFDVATMRDAAEIPVGVEGLTDLCRDAEANPDKYLDLIREANR